MNNKDCFVSQQEIAEHFKVNRTTIRAWTKQGMPYLDADRGKSGGYHIGHTLFWCMGKSHLDAIEYHGETSALEKIMVARLISSERDEYFSEETEQRFDNGLQIYGYSPEDVSKARNKMAGFLAGWRHAVAVRREHLQQSVVTERES
ncbi:TPA: hypothetical protein O1K60_000700 [Escherichia coli]|nr:hypothetical protein [Escherichia coli]HCY2736803.1 hypothetical protein [Escherichia coli]